MPTRDKFHEAVKTALQKDGWTITDDPLYLGVGGVDLYIDLAAEKLIAAEKDDIKIAVEVKSFVAPSLISEFHTALGQFINYRIALAKEDEKRKLYLAVPEDTYEVFFSVPFFQTVVETQGISLIAYDPEHKEVRKWHE